MKRLLCASLITLIIAMLVSCGTEQETEQEQLATAEEEEAVYSSADAEEANTSPLSPVIETGTYVGQIDPHTVQIESENGINAYQLSEQTVEQISTIEEGIDISFSFIENENNQLVLQSIEKIENSSNEHQLLTETGTYVGQIDPHTIEIKVKGESKAFQLSDEAQMNVENLTEGQEVTFQYYENGQQLVITQINSNE